MTATNKMDALQKHLKRVMQSLNLKQRQADRRSEKICQIFTDRLKERYELVYTDWNDNFDENPRLIDKCMKSQSFEPLCMMDFDYIDNMQYESCKAIIEEIKTGILANEKYAKLYPYIEKWLDNRNNFDEIRYRIQERDMSEPVKEFIERTTLRARVTLYSNCECLPSNRDNRNTYRYEDYFKQMVDVLYLNPALVRRTFAEKEIRTTGRFPDLSYRNGKEAVEYVDFAVEMLNQTSYCQLVFMGILPLKTMYAHQFKAYKTIKISGGNSCGMFDSGNGAGSLLDMKLKRDLMLPYHLKGKSEYDKCVLVLDEKDCGDGYSIDEVYGLIRPAWGKEFEPVYNNNYNN